MLMKKAVTALAVTFGIAAIALPAMADDLDQIVDAAGGRGGGPSGGGGGGGGKGGKGGSTAGVWYSWMADDVDEAWGANNAEFIGQGVTITMVDDFGSRDKIIGVWNGKVQRKRHGEWTSLFASSIAPGATMAQDEFDALTDPLGDHAVALTSGFDVINASYGALYAPGTFSALDLQEQSIVDAAFDTTASGAVVTKSAGNAGVAVGSAIPADAYGGAYTGWYDELSLSLIGAPNAIFVGALTDNGSGVLADYSNFAGTNTTVQNQFLVVGVDSGSTALAGTSFAAPIVAGYAAIVSSKFTTATPTMVVDQLLATADDTFAGYDVTLHGQGEACITCALSPITVQ